MDYKSIDDALLAARKSLGPTVHKGGWNQAQKFNYVGHEQVVKATREALHAHGLMLTQISVKFRELISWTGKSGPQSAMLWDGTFRLVGWNDHRTYEFAATTLPSDKGAYIASTALDRTALLRVLGLAGSADEDPEHDAHDRQYDQGTGETPQSQRNELPQQQQQQGDQWQRGDDSVVLARLRSDMELMRAHVTKISADPAATSAMAEPLTDWSAELFALRTKQSKSAHWAAFGQVCQAAGLDPQAVSGAGRKKAAEVTKS